MAYRRFFVRLANNQVMPLRRWADENRQYFPRYRFTNSQSDFPVTQEIARVLERILNCRREEENGNVYLIFG